MDIINEPIAIQEKPTLETPNQAEIAQESKEVISDSYSRACELEEDYQASLLPEGFFIRGNMLFYQAESPQNPPSVEEDTSKKSQKKAEPTYVSSRLDVVACTRDRENENHGRLLEFRDVDGHLHRWAMPMTCLAGDGTAYREILLSKGLKIAPGTKPRGLLTMYIQSCDPKERARCVDKIGWYEGSFVFPEETIGNNVSEKILFQGFANQIRDYSTKGTLEEWKTHVASLCQSNSRLVLGISAAFAAPLLQLLNHESGGLHFRGNSSIGKSIILKLASSVWGGNDPVVSWRTTTNGLEAIAVLHNDGLLCLDEIAQIDPEQAGSAAYMLANSMGKQRADQKSNARKKRTWRILFLSNGEISLAQHMEKCGETAKAGQEVRIIDVPAEVKEKTIFECLHGFASDGVFAEHLDLISRQYYGTPIREFLNRLIAERDHAIKSCTISIEKLVNQWLPAKASGQVRRVLRRFVAVGVGGELATTFGITGWKQGEAIEAAKQCWLAWLLERGGSGQLEELQVLSQVRRFFALHGDSRFSPWNPSDTNKTINRAGFKKDLGGDTEFYVYPEIFRKDICEGLNPIFVGKVCILQGLLIPDRKGKPTRGENLPGHGKNVRCYRFTSRVLGEEIPIDELSEKMV